MNVISKLLLACKFIKDLFNNSSKTTSKTQQNEKGEMMGTDQPYNHDATL